MTLHGATSGHATDQETIRVEILRRRTGAAAQTEATRDLETTLVETLLGMTKGVEWDREIIPVEILHGKMP